MTGNQPKSTLRALAKLLGCTHAALSKAVRVGRLTNGVRLDARRRIVVLDAAAAAAQWRSVHIPQTDEMISRDEMIRRRREEEAKAKRAEELLCARGLGARREQAATTASAAPHQVTIEDGGDAYDLLAFCLTWDALDREPARTFVKRVTAHIREAVAKNYGDDVMASDAITLLANLVADAVEARDAKDES